ncbi:hypothetical protein SAMN06297421_104179 [Aristaeella hokkaidonensis]|nr:hypothetical protein SAMN06297421_104179 [Aristaeella hokkaidonensis]
MDFSLIKLSNSGKRNRNDACENLQKAINCLNEIQTILYKEKGIGTEFLLDKINDFKREINTCKSNMRNL